MNYSIDFNQYQKINQNNTSNKLASLLNRDKKTDADIKNQKAFEPELNQDQTVIYVPLNSEINTHDQASSCQIESNGRYILIFFSKFY